MQEDNKDLTMRNEETVVDNTDYVDAIRKIQENSVSKDKYDALVEDRKRLLEAVVNGQQLAEEKAEPLASRLEYYKKFKENKFATDMETMQNLVNLRKATIREYGLDPCVTGNFGLTPEGGRIEPTYGEAETIAEQFDIIEDILKEANGNPLEYQRLMQSHLPRK